MRIAVVANGDWDKEWGNHELSLYDLIVAADGGANHVLDSSYIPDVLVGDLDSIKSDYIEICREKGTTIQRYPREKDETDLELALEYAAKFVLSGGNGEGFAKEIKDISLLGATGGRIDHFLGNLFLMNKFLKKGLQISMKASDHELWLLEGLKRLVGKKGQQISLIPMTEKAIVRTEGLQYPLDQEVLHQGSPRGISNVFLGENAIIEVSQGTILVVLLSPENKS